MTNSRSMPIDVAVLLDAVGGEPLAGSGFEDEQPEPGFDDGEMGTEDSPRRTKCH